MNYKVGDKVVVDGQIGTIQQIFVEWTGVSMYVIFDDGTSREVDIEES